MKVLEERLMYLFIVCLQGTSLCFYSILAQGLSFVRLHFSFPSLPHLVLNSFPMLYQLFDLAVSPYFFYWSSEFCFVYDAFVLIFHYSALHFRAE